MENKTILDVLVRDVPYRNEITGEEDVILIIEKSGIEIKAFVGEFLKWGDFEVGERCKVQLFIHSIGSRPKISDNPELYPLIEKQDVKYAPNQYRIVGKYIEVDDTEIINCDFPIIIEDYKRGKRLKDFTNGDIIEITGRIDVKKIMTD